MREADLTPRPPLQSGEGEVPTQKRSQDCGEGEVPTQKRSQDCGEGEVPTQKRSQDCGEGEVPTQKDFRDYSVTRNQKINPEKLELAKQFRKNSTDSEDAVWQMLRNRQIKNLKWRRQQVIDGNIADFYCAELNAVLEIDGSVHDSEETKEYDEYRFIAFESKGIRTFRLRNEDCDKEHLTELIENIINGLR